MTTSPTPPVAHPPQLAPSPLAQPRLAPPNILTPRRSSYPAGPRFIGRVASGAIFRQNAADFMTGAAARYGDLNHYRGAGRHIFQFNHPELIQEMLVRDAPRHHRGLVMQRARFVLGEGLLTSEEPAHMRQRRLAQPAFHRQRIAAYGDTIASYTAAMTAGWQSGQTRDLHQDMLLLALRIVGKTLFDTNVDAEVRRIAAAVDSFMGFLPLAFLPFPNLIQRLPLPAMTRIRRGQAYLDQMIYRMIAERRADPRDRGDLLSMLLASVDADPEPDNPTDASHAPRRMTDRQVRDECVTVMLAGHETTANALSFALWELARHPAIQDRLHAECRAVLGDRLPSAADYSRLRYAERVFSETLRLHPPVWVTARTAAQPYDYRGFSIPQGALLVAPQLVAHHDPRFWPHPLRFDPERFTDEARAERPRFTYFPFGAGSRQCIGEGLAWMEGVLILAAIASSWRLSLPPGAPAQLPVKPAISLRPAQGVHLTLHPAQA